MRITGLGHAGMFIETTNGTILCDPWVKPAFFGSWFPFPDNRGLDWERFGRADFLYISHRHRDHFDPWLLEQYVPKGIQVLLPEYPTDDLEQDIRDLGYSNILYAAAGEVIERGALRIMVTPMRAPSDGPIGDSCLSVDDGTASIIDQNDSHPIDVDKLLRFGTPDAYFTQFSGAIWWPMVYDLPLESKRHFAKLKREAQHKRAMYYVDKIDAPHVFPMAGPPMFLRDDLFDFNGDGRNGDAIFTDQAEFIGRMEAEDPKRTGHMFLPGTVIDINDGEVKVTQTLLHDDEIRSMFADKWAYFEHQRSTRQHEIVEEIESRSPILPPDEMLAALQEWWEPLLRRGRTIRRGVGGPVRFTIGELDMIVDFPKGKLRKYAGEETGYWFTIPADLVSTNIAEHEIDWSNSIFLSCQFQAGRVGKFNEFIYTFLKCLSKDRVDYVENWYAEQADPTDNVTIDGWTLQRRCPHLRADLTRTGKVDNGILTCSLHDWKWDLSTGRCLSSHSHPIRVADTRQPAMTDGAHEHNDEPVHPTV